MVLPVSLTILLLLLLLGLLVELQHEESIDSKTTCSFAFRKLEVLQEATSEKAGGSLELSLGDLIMRLTSVLRAEGSSIVVYGVGNHQFPSTKHSVCPRPASTTAQTKRTAS